jgi:hypothetical protein
MTTEHRKAPRRDVVDISREGAWGKVKYKHLLSCGHTEVRQRAASTPKLACAWCLRALDKDVEMKALVRGPSTDQDDIDSRIAKEEINISRMKASIASKFNIPLDAIDIVANDVDGKLQVKHALLFLSSSDVARLSQT